ncbi:MAG TPA: GAF domain-containing protein [Anaerolineae bacterium]|nr:GAF domain-containing protein [Anaerolineae bacterium]
MLAAGMRIKIDYLERFSRVLTLAALVLAVVTAFAAPLLAISWSNVPFPGMLMEHTLVVNDIKGHTWGGQLAGIDYPQRVIRVAGAPVNTTSDVRTILANAQDDQTISFFTRLPSGETRLYPAVTLIRFPLSSMVRLFWVPYFVGLTYLGIGIWVFRAKGMARPGRALSFFCFCAAMSCMLFFEAATSHMASWLWVASLAMLGGALVSLAMRFPEEWSLVERHPWLLGLPYASSTLLAVWAVAVLGAVDPWAYISSRYAIYLHTVIGVLVFLGIMLYRARSGSSLTIRRQARLVTLGSVLAFGPLVLWFIAAVLGPKFSFDIALLLPPLVLFPLSVAVAIFRYRLLEVDAIVNRTIFYGVVTAILAGVISVSMGLTQRFFLAVTGEKSDVAAVITTLVVVSAFEPIKARVRGLVERTFKEAPDHTATLRTLGQQVQSFVEVSQRSQIARRLLDEAAQAMQAQSGALSLVSNGQMQRAYTYGRWQGESWMTVPLEWKGERYGLLSLGPRQSLEPYTRQECQVLQQVANQVAGAVHLATVNGSRA